LLSGDASTCTSVPHFPLATAVDCNSYDHGDPEVKGAETETAILQLYTDDATPDTVTLFGPVQVAAHAAVVQHRAQVMLSVAAPCCAVRTQTVTHICARCV
jgi:hypothetical protein